MCPLILKKIFTGGRNGGEKYRPAFLVPTSLSGNGMKGTDIRYPRAPFKDPDRGRLWFQQLPPAELLIAGSSSPQVDLCGK